MPKLPSLVERLKAYTKEAEVRIVKGEIVDITLNPEPMFTPIQIDKCVEWLRKVKKVSRDIDDLNLKILVYQWSKDRADFVDGWADDKDRDLPVNRAKRGLAYSKASKGFNTTLSRPISSPASHKTTKALYASMKIEAKPGAKIAGITFNNPASKHYPVNRREYLTAYFTKQLAINSIPRKKPKPPKAVSNERVCLQCGEPRNLGRDGNVSKGMMYYMDTEIVGYGMYRTPITQRIRRMVTSPNAKGCKCIVREVW
jgi:hypothetical protein